LETKKPKDFLPYVKGIFQLLNNAYSDLYGVVPLTDKQVELYTKQYFSFDCQGLVNFVDGVPLSFSASLDGEPLKPGNIAYVRKAVPLDSHLFALSVDSGVNFRYVVTTGNQVDLDVVDFGRYIIEDKEVKLLILYWKA